MTETLEQTIVAYICMVTIYYRLISPLSGFPAPWAASVSNIPYAWHTVRGSLHTWISNLHARHGPIVRIRPCELSIIDPSAWKDIYAARPQWPKYRLTPEVGVASIATADDANHARHRSLLAHAFSEKAMAEQEPILHHYTDLLRNKVREQSNASPEDQIDMEEWYNYLAFDVVAHLCFGEPFHNLERHENHPWVKAVQKDMKIAVLTSPARLFSFIPQVVKFLLPRIVGTEHHLAYQYSQIKIEERLARTQGKPDFMTYFLRHGGQTKMSLDEIQADFSTLINAGSETTGTALAGCTFYLLRDRTKLETLEEEVRTRFKDETQITAESVKQLDYLSAVLMEGLRLYPPLPVSLPRTVPKGGAFVSQRWVPGGVCFRLSFLGFFVMLTTGTDCCGHSTESGQPFALELREPPIVHA